MKLSLLRLSKSYSISGMYLWDWRSLKLVSRLTQVVLEVLFKLFFFADAVEGFFIDVERLEPLELDFVMREPLELKLPTIVEFF